MMVAGRKAWYYQEKLIGGHSTCCDGKVESGDIN